MRTGGRILMIFGVVLGIIAAVATFIILRESTPEPGEEAGLPTTETQVVMVAFQTIEPWQEIPIDAIGPREYPEPIPSDAVLTEMPAPSGEGGEEGETIPGEQFIQGKISNTRIYPGQVIVTTQLVDKELEEQRLGLGSNLSYIIPDGQVAMAVRVDNLSSIAGALSAGDQVDVIATVNVEFEDVPGTDEDEGGEEPETVTQLLLQRVQILRVGPWRVQDSEEQQQSGLVTILLEPQQALELKRITDGIDFNWTFVLRAITDESDFVTEPVTDQYMIEQYNLLP